MIRDCPGLITQCKDLNYIDKEAIKLYNERIFKNYSLNTQLYISYMNFFRKQIDIMEWSSYFKELEKNNINFGYIDTDGQMIVYFIIEIPLKYKIAGAIICDLKSKLK